LDTGKVKIKLKYKSKSRMSEIEMCLENISRIDYEKLIETIDGFHKKSITIDKAGKIFTEELISCGLFATDVTGLGICKDYLQLDVVKGKVNQYKKIYKEGYLGYPVKVRVMDVVAC